MTNNELADLLEGAARRLRKQQSEHSLRPTKISLQIEPETRLCVSIKEGARILDISVSAFKRLKFKKVKIGHSTRYRVNTIKDYLDRQEKNSQ